MDREVPTLMANNVVDKRRLGLCAAAGSVLLLVAAAQAGAEQSRRITLQVGDAFEVAGTDLACQTQVGKNVIRGQKLVTCFKVTGPKLAANSYIVALGANGRVVVARIKADGNIGNPVFDRKPAALGSGAKQYTVHAGDQLRLSGTDLVCVVNNDVSGVYPTCFRTAGKGGVPGSYAIAETEKFVAVVRFDSAGKTSKVVFKREHGR